MMRGSVNPDREAVIMLEICGTAGDIHHVEAAIDTGFNGWLTLPDELIRHLGLPSAGTRHDR